MKKGAASCPPFFICFTDRRACLFSFLHKHVDRRIVYAKLGWRADAVSLKDFLKKKRGRESLSVENVGKLPRETSRRKAPCATIV